MISKGTFDSEIQRQIRPLLTEYLMVCQANYRLALYATFCRTTDAAAVAEPATVLHTANGKGPAGPGLPNNTVADFRSWPIQRLQTFNFVYRILATFGPLDQVHRRKTNVDMAALHGSLSEPHTATPSSPSASTAQRHHLLAWCSAPRLIAKPEHTYHYEDGQRKNRYHT